MLINVAQSALNLLVIVSSIMNSLFCMPLVMLVCMYVSVKIKPSFLGSPFCAFLLTTDQASFCARFLSTFCLLVFVYCCMFSLQNSPILRKLRPHIIVVMISLCRYFVHSVTVSMKMPLLAQGMIALLLLALCLLKPSFCDHYFYTVVKPRYLAIYRSKYGFGERRGWRDNGRYHVGIPVVSITSCTQLQHIYLYLLQEMSGKLVMKSAYSKATVIVSLISYCGENVHYRRL